MRIRIEKAGHEYNGMEGEVIYTAWPMIPIFYSPQAIVKLDNGEIVAVSICDTEFVEQSDDQRAEA